MKKFLFFLSFAILPLIVFGANFKSKTRNFVEERASKTIIVSYKKRNMIEGEVSEVLQKIKTKCNCQVKHLQRVGAFILTYDHTNHSAAASLELDIENWVAIDDRVISILDDDIKLNETPRDPLFNKQWALDHSGNDADINAVEGWDEYLSDSIGGSDSGPNVIVAVIDTGVDYNHPDLRNMMWTNPGEIEGNGIDDDGNGVIDDVFGVDFSTFSPSNDPMDRDGHGTHCAGVIGAKENNWIGIAGVASYAQGKIKIMAVKALNDEGLGTTGDLLSSLDYAIENGARVSSNSWGSSSSVSSYEDRMWSNVLENNLDHIFVAAAGNENLMLDSSYKPLACGLDVSNLICVAASNINDEKSSFSNYGKDLVHVFAPGTNIVSTYPRNRYAILSGTSMATPHVSGLAALVLSMRNSLDGFQVKTLIEDNVQKKDAYQDIVSSGGLIDVARTLEACKTLR